MTFDENFPKRLSSARNVVGLTQSNLASMAETVVRQIAAYEAGDARPRAKTLKKIAAALGTTEEWLCSGIGAGPTSESFSRIRNIKQIPVLESNHIDDFINSDIVLAGTKMHACDLELSKSAFAYEVMGDSMKSSSSGDTISIPNGTIVTIDPDGEFFSGGIALISTNDGLVRVKKVTIEKNYATIISLNRNDYPAEIYELTNIKYIYPVMKAEYYLDNTSINNEQDMSHLAWDRDFLPDIKGDGEDRKYDNKVILLPELEIKDEHHYLPILNRILKSNEEFKNNGNKKISERLDKIESMLEKLLSHQ